MTGQEDMGSVLPSTLVGPTRQRGPRSALASGSGAHEDPSRGVTGVPPVADRNTLARKPEPGQFLREKYGLPDDWHWYKWEAFGPMMNRTGALFTGAVVREVYKRGPRKGTPNFNKRLRETECSYPVIDADLDEWIARWEVETGYCSRCWGTGREWAGWDHINGNRHRDCRKCAATGLTAARREPPRCPKCNDTGTHWRSDEKFGSLGYPCDCGAYVAPIACSARRDLPQDTPPDARAGGPGHADEETRCE